MTDPFSTENKKGFITFEKGSKYAYLNEPTPVEPTKEEEKDDFVPETYADYGIKPSDSLNPFKMFDSNEWANNPQSREDTAKKISDDYYNKLLQSDATVPAVIDGEVKQVPASLSGRLTNAGLHAYNSSLEMIGMAQKREDGGFVLNPLTGKREPAFGSKFLTPYNPVKDRSQEKRQADENGYGASEYELSNKEIFGRDHVSSVIEAYKRKNELDDEDVNIQNITPERFVEIRNSLRDSSPTDGNFELQKKINGSNDPIIDEQAKKEYADALGYYAKEKQLGDKLVDTYNGEPVINYDKITDINQFEEAVKSLQMPAADKARFLASFRRDFEEEASKILQEQYTGSLAAETVTLGIADGGDEAMQRYAESNKTAYEFLKENPFYSKDQSYFASSLKRIGLRTINSFQNTAIGASTLALGAVGYVADKLGLEGVEDVARRGTTAMAEAGATSNEILQANAKYQGGINKAFSIGQINVTDEDIYSLLGQVAETFATAGLSRAVSIGAKAGTAAAEMTVAQALKAGGAKAAEKIAAKQGAGVITRSATQMKEAAISLWTNSSKVKAAENLLATSLQGSFGSAGQALSTAYGEAINKGLSREDALAEATGKATANGLATFTAMSLMNMVAPGVEKVLMSPETTVGLGQALRNTLARRSATKGVSAGLKDIVSDKTTRSALSKGVADAIRGQVAKEGIGGYIGAVALSGVSEGLEEMLDTALSTTIDAYLNNSPEARREMEKTGFVFDILKSGILGAMMGSGTNVVSFTSKEKKAMAINAKKSMDAYLQDKLPQLPASLQQQVFVSQADKAQPQLVSTIDEILKNGTPAQQVEALANLGNVAAVNAFAPQASPATTTPPASAAPTPTATSQPSTTSVPSASPETFDALDVDTVYQAPNGSSWTRKNGAMGEPVMIGVDPDGNPQEMTTIEFAQFVNNQNKQEKAAAPTEEETQPAESAPKLFTISGAAGAQSKIKAPVESEADLASYAYEQAHGKSIPAGKLAPTKKEVLTGGKANRYNVTSYNVDGKPADLHSIEVDKDGNPVKAGSTEETTTLFATKEKLTSLLGLSARSQGLLESTNEFADVATEVQPQKKKAPEKKESTPEKQESKEKPAPKAEAESKPEESKQPEAPVEKVELKVVSKNKLAEGEEKLSPRQKTSVSKFSKTVEKVGGKIVVVDTEADANEYLRSIGKAPNDKAPAAFALLSDGKPVIVLIKKSLDKYGDIDTAIKHELFHAIELQFMQTSEGRKLYNDVNLDSVVKRKDLIAFMEKEYSPDFASLDSDVAFMEVMRAFIAGKIHKETFTYTPFAKYFEAFIKYLKKIVGRDKELNKYATALEKAYLNAIKGNEEAFGLKAASSEKFKGFMSSVVDKAKNLVKSSAKTGSAIQTGIATDDDISELVSDARIEIANAYNESANANDIFNLVANMIEERLIGVGTGLSVASKLKAYREILGELNDDTSTEELRALFQGKIDRLNTDKSPVIAMPANQLADTKPIEKKLGVAGWSGIRRFVTGVREDGMTQAKSVNEIAQVKGDELPFTNAFIADEIDKETGKYPDRDLKFGDALESLDSNGVVNGYLIYSHSVETINPETKIKYMTHRFMKSPVLKQNGKISPFFSVRQSQYAREFYEMVTDSNVINTMFKPTNEGLMIDSPEGLIKLVFNSLTSNRTVGADGKTPEAFLKQGDKSIKYADVFQFVTGDNKDGTSPFYFKNGKIVVNTTKLAKNFSFINNKAIENDEQKTSIALMVASTVRAALEEEILHLATVNLFDSSELVSFYDELQSLGYFNDMIDQIRAMQGIGNANDSLTEKEKNVIAAEIMSFTHQRASNGATYGDEYQRLVEGLYARADQGGRALETARQYGQTLNNILMARAATSFMSPRMQQMLERLNKAKVELGVNQRLNNTDKLVAGYLSEQYKMNRANLQKSIDSAFMQESVAVEEFRSELKAINVPIRQVIDIDFQNGTIEIDPDFAKYYQAKHGTDKYDGIVAYFSRLNESQTAKDLARSVRSSRQVMDAMRVSLDLNDGLDNLAAQLTDGNFDSVIEYLKSYSSEDGISFDSLIQIARSFEFADNIEAAYKKDLALIEDAYNDPDGDKLKLSSILQQFFPKGPTLSNLDYVNKTISDLLPSNTAMVSGVSRIMGVYTQFEKPDPNDILSALQSALISQGFSPNQTRAREAGKNRAKRDEALSLLINKNVAPNLAVVVPSYAPFAEAVNNYNDLILSYDEIILNKNLNRVDDFGREFISLTKYIPKLSRGINFQPNLFGYANQYASEAINDRSAVGDRRGRKESEDAIKQSIEWQNLFLGRYTSNDRQINPDKVMAHENNANYAGEQEYNLSVIGRMIAAPLLYSTFDTDGNRIDRQMSYDEYYKTMGFQPVVNRVRVFDGYADPAPLNENLLKYSITDKEIKLSSDISVNIRGLNGKAANIVFNSNPSAYNTAIKQLTGFLFEGNDAGIKIDDWFNVISGLIGYNEKTGEPMVVESINGEETFASKFAKQIMFRLFGKNPEDNTDRNLKEYIQLLDRAYKATRPGQFGDVKKLSDNEKRDIINELPFFLELIDAANRDIGLARKAYSRFKSKFLNGTINADIRLIQEQGAAGIRANDNLRKAIAESYYDIQAMFDIEWHSNYLANGGPIGYQGLTALQLMDEFARIPSSASKEYFLKSGQMMPQVGRSQDAYKASLQVMQYDKLPSEMDEEFLDERVQKEGEFTESQDLLPSGYEGTAEQLKTNRRIEGIQEDKRMKSWVTHAALSIFQSIPNAKKDVYKRTISPDRAKRFFYLFTQAQDNSSSIEEKKKAQADLRGLVGETMKQLGKRYSATEEFAQITDKLSTYNHPYLLLMDVVEIIAGKEKQFVDEQRLSAESIANNVIEGLRNNVIIDRGAADQIESPVIGSGYYMFGDDARKPQPPVFGKNATNFEKKKAYNNYARNLERWNLEKRPERALGKSTFNRNAVSSQEILDSIEEDIEKGKLLAGTLFNARTFQLGDSESMMDSSLFMNTPLFSMLLQAFPNLIVYQPATYSGKTKNVSRNIDIAYLENGDAVLYIDNAVGLGSSQQQEILEKLIIARIGQERAIGKNGLESAINFAAENIRKQVRYAFNVTPARIDAMVEKADSALRSIQGMPPEAIQPMLDKYRQSIEKEATEKLALLAGNIAPSRFAENAYGLNSIDANSFFETLLGKPKVDNVSVDRGIYENLRIVTEMFTNPEAYDVLSKIKAPESDLITDTLNPRYEAFIEKALRRFQAKEVQSSMAFEIQLDKGGKQMSQLDEDGFPETERDLTDYADPTFAVEFLYDAFERNFLEAEPSEKSYAKIKKNINKIKKINPDTIRNLVDRFLAESAVANTSGKLKYSQISPTKEVIDELDYKPDFMYRYVASELINALSPASDYASTIEDIKELPSEKSAYEIIQGGAFPLLVENTGNANVSSYGNLTNFYYGHSPLTDIFERRRKGEFVDLLASKTEVANNLLNDYIRSSIKSDANNRVKFDIFENPDLIFEMRNSLENMIGVDNVNLAALNVSRLRQRNDELNKSARERIANIDAEIVSLQQQGRDLTEAALIKNAEKKLSDASEVMDRVASAIADLVADKQVKINSYSNKIARSLSENSGEAIASYKEKVTQITDFYDDYFKTLIEERQSKEITVEQFDRSFGNAINERNRLAREINATITGISLQIAQQVTSNIENGAFGILPPNAELAQEIENRYLSDLYIPLILDYQVSESTPMGIMFSKFLTDKSFKTRAASKVFSADYISKILDTYLADKDLRDRVSAVTESKKQLFSQLKKNGKLSKIIDGAIKANRDVFDREQIKKNVASTILTDDKVLEAFSNEFAMGFGDFIDTLDNKDAESGLIAESEEAIGIDNTGRAISMLIAEREQLQKTIKERQGDPSTSKRTLMQLRKSLKFDENTTRQRIINHGNPVFDMLIDLDYDPSKSDDDELKERIELQTEIIQEAARLFIEREGEALYKALREDIDVFGLGFDVEQNIDNVLAIVDIRNRMAQKAQDIYETNADPVFDDEIAKANEKAKQMFGVTVKDMVTYNLEPVVIYTEDRIVDGELVKADSENAVYKKLEKKALYTSQKERLKNYALFIEDEYQTSVFMPTTTRLQDLPSKTYLLYNQGAQNELKQIKQKSGAKWTVDSKFKDIIFRAAQNPGKGGQGGLKTQTHKEIDVDPNSAISAALADVTKVDPKTTVKDFIKMAKKNFSGFFIKNSIGQSISDFAQGIGIVGTIKPINKLKDDEIKDAFSEIHSFASNANNQQVLQNSGMELLTKAKGQYSEDEQKAIVEKAYGIAIKENPFLNPASKASHALLLYEAQLSDIINMLNSKDMESKGKNFAVYVEQAVDSIGKLFNIEENIKSARPIEPYNLSRGIADLDLGHNYARLFSILYASETMHQLVVGAISPEKADDLLSMMTVHENALLRRKFSGGIGSYNEALNLVGLIDHGINGASGRNRYNAEYQAFQNKMGNASKDLNNDFLNGAKAMLIASLKGIKMANQKDGGTETDYALKVHQWAYMFRAGYKDYKKIDENKNKFKQTANKLSRTISRIKPIGRKQAREGAATDELYSLLERDVNFLANIIGIKSYSEAEIDTFVQNMISKLEAGLSQEESAAVSKYSNALLEEFSDIYEAHRIANMFATRDNRVKISENKIQSPEKMGDALSRPYSILPLKAGYVRNPLNASDNEFDEGSLSINEFIGFERSSMNYKGRRSLSVKENVGDPLRPLDLNPFTAVDGLASDAMYRTFLAPTFGVIKKLMGNVEFNDKRQMVTSEGFLHGIASEEIGGIKNSEYFPHIASYIMHTIEKNIRNDMPKLLEDSMLSDMIKVGNISTLVRALFSIWQIPINGLLPAVSKYLNVSMMNGFSHLNWFGVTHKPVEALSSAYKHAIMNYGKDESDIAKFVKENSINSYKWKAEGSNTRETQINLAKYHKENRIKYGSRWLAARVRDVGEKSLEYTIGGPERANVQAIFTFELFNELQRTMGDKAPQTIEEMFKMNPDDISTLAKTKADIMVADFMGMSDKAKKAGVYNLDVKRPLASLLVSGLTRFGNHKLTTNANLMVYGKHLFMRALDKEQYDKDITQNAVENIAGTLLQNVLYHFAKAQVMIPVFTWAAAALTTFFAEFFDEDEPDESKLQVINERYYDWLEAMTQVLPEQLFVFNWIKEQIFPYMSAYKNIDEGIGSGLTETLAKATENAMWETTGFVPMFGAGLGMPAIESAAKVVTSYGASAIMGTDEEQTYKDRMAENRDKLRQAERAFGTFYSPISEPIEATKDMSAVILNYMAPKDGFDGISTQEFVYGLLSQSMGTREGKTNQARRHKEEGGWGSGY